MKFILPLLILVSGLASAVPLRIEVIEWDANPPVENVTAYEVFRGIDRIAVVTTNEAKLELPYETSVITVRAVNAQGVSIMSDPLTINPITDRLKITAEFSYDLLLWTGNPPPHCFTRVKIEIP